MKILLLGGYYPFLSAATARLADFAHVLSNKGIEVSVLSPITIRKRARWMEISNGIFIMRFFAISPVRVPIVGGLFNILSASFTSSLLFLLRRPDVAIASLPPGEPPLGVAVVSKLFRKPLVFDVRDQWEDFRIGKEKWLAKLWYSMMKKVYNRVYNESLFCVAVNEMIIDHLVERGIERVHLVPHGLNTSLFAPMDKAKIRNRIGLNPSDFIVVYAGIFQEYYRIDVVIRALHKLAFEKGIKNLKLLIVGSGPRMGEYRSVVNELEFSEHVYFAGLKVRKEVAEYLACSDVGLIPYDDNALWLSALPTKFYEYCSSGLPIVASALGDSLLADYIEKWRVGLIVEPLDVEELSSAIEFLYSHDDKRREMGANGRKQALIHFDREKITSDMLKMILDNR
ncbi:MAG: glycosyltransferase family 4 protein [Candidatus Bathyarchaeia archaeon]